jgi:GNAT superfamily N-acetyltransferase
VRIRPAVPADAAGLRALCAESLPLDPDAAELPGILRTAPGPALTLVSESAGQLTGIACGALRPDPAEVRGHLDLLAVAPSARGDGTGARLLGAAEEELRSGGATTIGLGQGPPVWLWPGVDPRYTAMVCLAERAGYQRRGEQVNMVVDLGAAPLDTDADERRLAAAGITVRRAAAAEAGDLAAWLRAGPWADLPWSSEAVLALPHEPPGCHVAVRAGAYLAFACHGCNRRGWFGPMGTLAAERQHGLGTVLLRRCLADLRAAGYPTAHIGWTGPIRFYARAVGARIDRTFWYYEKALPGPAGPGARQ